MDDANVLLMVMQFLRERGYERALTALSEESETEFDESKLVGGGLLMATLTEYDELTRIARLDDPQRSDPQLMVPGDESYVRRLVRTIADVHTGNVLAVRFSGHAAADQRLVATGSADRAVRVIAAGSGALVWQVAPFSGGVLSVDWHPMHRDVLLAAAMDGSHAVIDVARQTVVRRVEHHRKYVVAARWAPDGSRYATASYDHSVALWRRRPAVADASASVSSSSSSHDAAAVEATTATATTTTTGGGDGDGSLDFELERTVSFSGQVEAMVFSADGAQLVVAVRGDNYLHYITVDPDAAGSSGDAAGHATFNVNANGDDHMAFAVLDLAVSPPALPGYLLAATDRGRFILFRYGTALQSRNYYGTVFDEYSQPRVAWHPSGKYFYATSQDNRVYVFDVVSSRMVATLGAHKARLRDLTVDPTNGMLATCSFDKTVKLFDSGKE